MNRSPGTGTHEKHGIGMKDLTSLLASGLTLCVVLQCSGRSRNSTTPAAEAFHAGAAAEQAIGEEAAQKTLYQSRTNAITRAVSQASPAVVGINVTQLQQIRERSIFEDDPFWGYFFPPRDYYQKVQGLGSGFLISRDGFILTNEHVIHDAVEIVATMPGGKQVQAELVGKSERYDVALLKIEGDDFPFIPLGDSNDLITGEWVIALGNPFGLFDVSSKPTVTVGVISAVGMDFKEIEGRLYDDMIQTDASINGGNSGGPLVNSLGRCIGINTFIISGSTYSKGSVGIGFAIPIDRVKKMLPVLKKIGANRKPADTGIGVENLTWLQAQRLGIRPDDGVLVTRVARNSTAAKAGVREGDVLVSINGSRVRSTLDVEAVNRRLDIVETPSMALRIFRGGKLIDVNVPLLETEDLK
ncbi:trypsin-like peptidase domain-containing protein [bacterium]|nr:trypsin-like peptidase domain-containing protein [bacterium]